MTLGEKFDELDNQSNKIVPEDLRFLEDDIRIYRENVRDEFLREAANQREDGSSLIIGLEVQARHASSQPKLLLSCGFVFPEASTKLTD